MSDGRVRFRPCSLNTHYVVVRQDLPLGAIAAQAVHAAGESGPALPGTFAVVLAARNEEDLLQLEERLRAAALPHVSIREPDPPYLGALMAIGFPPGPREPLRPYLKKFQLLKESTYAPSRHPQAQG